MGLKYVVLGWQCDVNGGGDLYFGVDIIHFQNAP